MKIILNDKGGLGNRMLIYSFFASLKKSFNCPIAIIPTIGGDYKKDELFCLTKDDEFFVNRNSKSKSIVKIKAFIEKTIFYLNKKLCSKKMNLFDLELNNQKLLNKLGIVSVTDGYIPISITNNNLTYVCDGYFQSIKYWKNIESEIKELFYRPDLITSNNSRLYQVIKENNSVCVHIRLGDYIENESTRKRHFVCNQKYYIDAIKKAEKEIDNPLFVVFTNDLRIAKEWLPKNSNIIYSCENNNAVIDMQLMTQCKNFIISNSTFSWWAQYLSKNTDKVVYAPDRWFNDGTKTDLYDEKWVLIETEEYK